MRKSPNTHIAAALTQPRRFESDASEHAIIDNCIRVSFVASIVVKCAKEWHARRDDTLCISRFNSPNR